MNNKYILSKLTNALNSFSDGDLRQLAALFSQPKVGEALVKLIDSTLALREAERKSKKRAQEITIHEAKPEKEAFRRKDQPIANSRRKNNAMSELRDNFVTVLNDRTLFPSTKDVVEVVNETLDCGVRYETFYRRGRAALINKCIHHLDTFPKQQQLNMLKSFFSKIEDRPSGMEQYQRLFRLLTGDE